GIAVDGIETESLEFGSQIDAYRLLGGPAHLLGKQYSSETGATTKLESPSRALAPWKDLEGVGPDVSGVGEYVASFAVSAADIDGGRLVLDLGSTSGGLGSVRVNGSEPRGFDTSRPVVDVTDLVRDGANDLVVRVSSSLNNRLIARGYYDAIPDIGLMLANRQGVHRTVVRDYGLQGPVRLHRVG
ncbi:MAG TPA: hypothetical protein PKG51_03930, partial [Arachnia sp.]|nr:hypothetical protein [Arachnia sp.]